MSDGGRDTSAQDLTVFQQNIMLELAASTNPLYGLRIKRGLGELYGDEISHPRLYSNLDELVDLGLVAKGERDKRTNEYALTAAGDDLLIEDASRRAAIAEGLRLSTNYDGGGD